MGQEAGGDIADLDPSWPLDTDQRRFGAHHLRIIKQALQTTFPGVDGPVVLTLAEFNQFSGFDVGAIDAATLNGRTAGFLRDAGNLNAGELLNARVQQSNVTQHQAALVILSGQLSTQVQTKTSSFSIDSAMDEDIIICQSASTINVTLLGGQIAVGDSIGFIRRGAGAVNFVAGASQTINTPAGLAIPVQHGKAAATYIANNTWELNL